jgi:hypothetical protein
MNLVVTILIGSGKVVLPWRSSTKVAMLPMRTPSTYFGNAVSYQEPIGRCRQQAHTGPSAIGTMRIWLNNGQSEANFVDCLFTIPLFIVFSDKYIVLVFLAYGLFKVAVVLDLSECFRSDQHTSNIDKLRQVPS